MAKVYVSSTIADLEPERRAVLDWLRLARHQAVDSYLPDSDTVRESCLDDVAGCDLYVLVLGHRYGFQPEEGNPEGLSITHQEFRRAGDCGIPRVALLRTSVPDVRLSDLQDPARSALVLAFRDEVAKQVRAGEFSDLQGLVQGLSTGVQGELAKLAQRPDNSKKEQADQRGTAQPALRLAPRPVFLAGREGLLAELDAKLAATAGSRPQVAVLAGLGGAGKTSVAIEYAHRHLDDAGVCWQFAAEDTAVLTAEFAVLAAELGAQNADARDPVAAVHAALARAPAGWLLVFDNVPDLASVQAFLPPAGPGRVLITSQSQHWPWGWDVQVPVLDTEVAAQFLAARTGDADQDAALLLAEELGGLPLALEQAAAYLQATGTSLSRYLALFRARQADLLARGEAAGHRDHVAATLGLALSRLAADHPHGVSLLRLLVFLAPEPVPLDLLLAGPAASLSLETEPAEALRPLLGDPVVVGDAIAALRRFSLAGPAGDGLVQVHRLVQAVTRTQLTSQQAAQWSEAAAALVETAIPAGFQHPGTWSAYALLLPHARAVLALASSGLLQVAGYLGHSGSHAAARDLTKLIVEAYLGSADHGAEHPNTLLARADLAIWTGHAGDAAGARDQYSALLPVYERVHGPENQGTLIIRNQLARWTGEAGDAAGARDQLAVLVPLTTAVLGPEHPESLTARDNLAVWTGETGDAAGARDQYAALLPVRERVSGPEHPYTLIARNQLARLTGRAGDAVGARDQLAVLVPLTAIVLGPEHPDTLTSRSNLAFWTGQAGDAAGARDQFAALLPVRERVLGPDHPNTLNVRAQLAHWTKKAGERD